MTAETPDNSLPDDVKAEIKEGMQKLLKSNVCIVRFEKSDGTQRQMRVTLKEDVAVPHEKKTDRVKKVNPDVVACWSIDDDGWRSFKVSKTISFGVEDPNAVIPD